MLDDGVLRWIGDVADGEVLDVRRVPAGSRTGYFVDLKRAGGDTVELFLQRRSRGGLGAFIGFEREAEVYRALEPLGIPIPHVWGVDEARDLFLVSRAEGHAWYQAPRDPAEAVAVAQEFMAHLARWHRAPVDQLDLPSFGPVRTVRAHQLDQLTGIRAVFAQQAEREPLDPLAKAQLDFLSTHVPDDDRQPVLVQGDTGPGNFLYAGGRITAIVDWELAHLGDPMDDIAWLSWRATQHGWPDFPARLREYEAASGIIVDPTRVAYYRLNACARLGPTFGLAGMGPARHRPAVDDQADAETDRTADGSGLIMSMLHRRMRLTAQADAMDIELPGRVVVEEATPGSHATLYDVVLGQLRGVVERVDDRVTAAMVKGAARQIKYLKEVDRNGFLFEESELDDLAQLLRRRPASLDDGRVALAAAARAGKVALEEYLLYHWQRLVRDDWMMRTASGAMYERNWPVLR